MAKNSPNKRKSQNNAVQTPTKNEINKKTPGSIKKNISKKQNTPKGGNKKQEKLQKFPGTAKLQVKQTDNDDANISNEESDYEVEQEVKPEKITKTMNEDNSDDSDDVDDSKDNKIIKKEIDDDIIETNKQSKIDRSEQIKAFIDSETAKGKMRYVLFIGNLPYEVTEEDVQNHFKNGINIKHIRLPRGKGEQKKPRGFGYLEVEDKDSYIKALSMHHTFLKGRRINVLYTTGGKKNSAKTKSIIKSKNFKLNALRRDGKLHGIKKDSNKRSVRRAKKRSFEIKTE